MGKTRKRKKITKTFKPIERNEGKLFNSKLLMKYLTPKQPEPLILALIPQKTLKICSSSLTPSLKSRMLVYMFSNTFLNQPCLIALKIYIREKKTIF